MRHLQDVLPLRDVRETLQLPVDFTGFVPYHPGDLPSHTTNSAKLNLFHLGAFLRLTQLHQAGHDRPILGGNFLL